MDPITFIVAVFCLVDDRLKGKRIRQRGPAPKLSDSEVLTIEIVGEFLGMDTDEALYRYFRRHYAEWFPALLEVYTGPPSPGRPPTSGSLRRTSLARAPRPRSSRSHLRYLRLDALAGMPLRSRLQV
jgi:hypothetical protein